MSWRKRAVGGAVGYAVAGPAGAVLGATLAGGRGDRGYDMSDIPTGVHVEADWEDDDAGRRWSLRFLSEIPATAYAELHLITDAGEKLQGRVPFCDEQGFFAATAPIHRGSSLLYVPFEAVRYESPKYISLEVTVWDAAPTTAVPVGKGTLDAALPKRSARPVVSIATTYLQPIVALATRVMEADGRAGDAQLERMIRELAGQLAVPLQAQAIAELRQQAAKQPSVEDAVRTLCFRSPRVSALGHLALLNDACFEDEQPTSAQRRELSRIEEQLTRAE
jgi:hypothetical protein